MSDTPTTSPWTWVAQLTVYCTAACLLASWMIRPSTGLGVFTTLALLTASQVVSVSTAILTDGTLELQRPSQAWILNLHHVLTVERAGWWGHRVRLHFSGDTPLGRSTLLLLPWSSPARLHPGLEHLREEICRAHQQQGASRVVMEHRRRREGDGLGAHSGQRLVEQFRAYQEGTRTGRPGC